MAALLTDAWAALFVGDVPGNRLLTVGPDGTAAVTEHRPDGTRRPATFTSGGRRRQTSVPNLVEQSGPSGPLDDVLATLATGRPKPAVGPEPQFETALVDRTPLPQWLATQPAGRHADRAAALGGGAREVPCRRCSTDGWLWDRCPACAGDGCLRCGHTGSWPRCGWCAGTGRQRVVLSLTVADPAGRRHTIAVGPADLDVDLVERTCVNAAELAGTFWALLPSATGPVRSVRVSFDRLADRFADAGLTVDVDDVRCGPRGTAIGPRHGRPLTSRGLPAGQVGDHAVGAMVSDATRLLAAPADPTLDGTARRVDLDRAALATHGPDGRATGVTLHVRPRRPATVTFRQLADQLPALQVAAGDRWEVRLLLGTGFIATGEHGPRLELLALPAGDNGRPVRLAGTVTHGLERAVETVADQLTLAGDPDVWVQARLDGR